MKVEVAGGIGPARIEEEVEGLLRLSGVRKDFRSSRLVASKKDCRLFWTFRGSSDLLLISSSRGDCPGRNSSPSGRRGMA